MPRPPVTWAHLDAWARASDVPGDALLADQHGFLAVSLAHATRAEQAIDVLMAPDAPGPLTLDDLRAFAGRHGAVPAALVRLGARDEPRGPFPRVLVCDLRRALSDDGRQLLRLQERWG